jgi:arylsulfatase A-like enzyme
MTRTIVFLAVLGLSALGGAARASAEDTVGHPNILLLFADDLGWGDVSCNHPASKIHTPEIDRLATAGLRFTDAHSSSGVCVPSRFSLLTGRHAFRLPKAPHPEPELRNRYGGLQATKPLIPAECPTLATTLSAAGYATAMVGKWHLGFDDLLRRPTEPLAGGPCDRGFDRYYGIPSSLDVGPYLFIENDRIVAQATEPMPAHASPGWPRPFMGVYWRANLAAAGFRHTNVLPELTRRAEGELRRLAQDRTQPFFFYYALPAPHSPLVPAKEFRGRTEIGIYGDYVTQTDAAIGRLLRVLEEAGAVENTLVLLTSDNGPLWYPENVEQTGHAAAGPWRGLKGDAWEGGHRVPLIARWPKHVPAGEVSRATVSLTDLLVTFRALLGVEEASASDGDETANQVADGVDFSPALRGQPWQRPTAKLLVARSSHGSNVLRSGDWKFIDRLGSGGFSTPQEERPAPGAPSVQLYNLSDDPAETKNLAASEPSRVKDFQQRLAKLLERD